MGIDKNGNNYIYILHHSRNYAGFYFPATVFICFYLPQKIQTPNYSGKAGKAAERGAV